MLCRLPSARLVSLIGLAIVAAPAFAGLGEHVSTIAKDQRSLKAAAAQVTRSAAYERHALRSANGVEVVEFAGRDGQVFAVHFTGPAMPDLKVLLGNRYSEYAAAVHPSPTTHKIYTHSSGTLELAIVKLPRGFTGSAYVPGAVPAGVNPRELQ
jgi:hypothetical protein